MKVFKIIFAIFLSLLGLFSGCRSNNAGVGMAATPTPQSAAPQGYESGATVGHTPDPPARAVLGESRVIATRQGPDGLEVDLTRVGFAGDLLTIELRYRNPTVKAIHLYSFKLEQVSFIDDATSKRYGVVKDESDQYMASPLTGGGKSIQGHYVKEKGYSIVWFKFPAPPPTTRTISINVPKISPFDGIRIQR